MERTLSVVNAMAAEGIIESYAIGGAMAAIFYAEPVPTYDLDVFILLAGPQGPVVTLEPIYAHLRAKGYIPSQEHILIEGIPVQFIPAYNALVEEAVRNAKQIAYGAQTARVVGPEYLAAIMLQTGRSKDRARIAQFLEQVSVDRGLLRDILARHTLSEKWDPGLGRLDA